MRSALASFLAGVVFALGLGIGGMTQPAKVIGFLDFAGNWDPSLAFVMLGAVGIHSIFYRLRDHRWFSPSAAVLSLPSRREIDSRLVGGAALFGLGWGLGGLCPGPALTSLVSGNVSVFIFSAAMIAGIVAVDFKEVFSARRVRAEQFRREIKQDM